MPDLLSTRRGRLTAFCLLYVTEGIPNGFASIAVVAQMRRQGLSTAAIGAFLATLYLPWSWKWAIGPVVDLVYSNRLGRRRGWILGAQLMMALTLLAAMPIDYAARLVLFTWVIVVHNVFAATQDVAIDALAVSTLREDERGVANGLMFAGAYTGQAIGGSGALYLSAWIDFEYTFPFVAGAILVITALVTLRLREPKLPALTTADEVPTAAIAPSATPSDGDRSASANVAAYARRDPAAASRLRAYVQTALRALFGTRAAVLGLIFALLPSGAYALNLALQSNLAIELQFSDQAIASIGLASTILAALGCVLGGWLSDRIGRRMSLALFVAMMSIPTALLALYLWRNGVVMPVDPTSANRPPVSQHLVNVFWAATLIYSLFVGLMYGARSAFFMDFCDPKVGATQFTAYMALLNFGIAYSAAWQGWSAGKIGYPMTLLIDAIFGCAGLLVLPWCRRVNDRDGVPPEPIAAHSFPA